MSALNNLKEAGKFNKELAAMSGRMVPKNLARRQKDFDAGPTSNDRPKSRWASGGFHRPGSQKK